jgi:hypothetical protein
MISGWDPRTLMAMTSDDLANLQCALLARARAPDLRVVLRLFDHDLAVRVPAGGARPASRSVSALAAPAFAAAILGRRVAAVLPVGTRILQIVGVTAGLPADDANARARLRGSRTRGRREWRFPTSRPPWRQGTS